VQTTNYTTRIPVWPMYGAVSVDQEPPSFISCMNILPPQQPVANLPVTTCYDAWTTAAENIL
jgi:hypothetical protein